MMWSGLVCYAWSDQTWLYCWSDLVNMMIYQLSESWLLWPGVAALAWWKGEICWDDDGR